MSGSEDGRFVSSAMSVQAVPEDVDEQDDEHQEPDRQRQEQGTLKAPPLKPERSFVDLAVLADEPDRDDVHRERHQEERRPDGEDLLYSIDWSGRHRRPWRR